MTYRARILTAVAGIDRYDNIPSTIGRRVRGADDSDRKSVV